MPDMEVDLCDEASTVMVVRSQTASAPVPLQWYWHHHMTVFQPEIPVAHNTLLLARLLMWYVK